MGRRGIGCTLERRVATPFSRTGQIYRSGPAIRSLVFGIPGLNGARSPSRRHALGVCVELAIGNGDPSPPPLFLLPDFSPPSRLHRWQGGVGIRGARRSSPRQRSHCFSLNNTSAIFELRCQRERYRILLPFCAVQTPPSPENAGIHERTRDEREREREMRRSSIIRLLNAAFFPP